MFRAIKKGDIPTINRYIQGCYKVNDNPLLFLKSCLYENTQVIELLLSNGADVNGTSDTIPLIVAVENGKGVTVNLLLKHGADPNRCGRDKITALHVAARRGYLIMATELLSSGANVNSVDSSGRTPLCVIVPHYTISRLLLNHGADPNVEPDYCLTPIQQAAYNGDVDTATILVQHGAKISHRALYYALTGKRESLRVVIFLLENGVDPNTTKRHGNLFHLFLEQCNIRRELDIETLGLFLIHGGDLPNTLNSQIHTDIKAWILYYQRSLALIYAEVMPIDLIRKLTEY